MEELKKKAVQVENFSGNKDWIDEVMRRVRRRNPGAQYREQNKSTIIVYMSSVSFPWSDADEEMFASLFKDGVVQEWKRVLVEEPQDIKESDHRKATIEDIGHRVRGGKALTPKQASVLFDDRQRLELEAQEATQDLEAMKRRAEDSEYWMRERTKKVNAMGTMLGEELRIKVYSKGDNIAYAQDTETGEIIASCIDRDANDEQTEEIYRLAIRHRIRQGSDLIKEIIEAFAEDGARLSAQEMLYCPWCQGHEDYEGGYIDNWHHDDDCIVLKARKLVEGSANA